MPKANGNHEEKQLAVVPPPPLSQDVEAVLLQGDLSKLNADQRLAYYNKLCRTLGLNPYTKPFDYLVLNGRMQLYARKDCTDQLRKIHGVSVDSATHNHNENLGIYIVSVEGHDRDNRKDAGTGVVNTKGLTGDALANAIMKAETKAKRRFTLSICGLGMLDETELETIPRARQFQPEPKAQLEAERIEVPAESDMPVDEKNILEHLIAAPTMGELAERFTKAYKAARKAGDTALMSKLYEYKEIRKAELNAAAKGN